VNTLEPTVYLVRHGRTALNADGRLRGLLDPPLDSVGHAQVNALAAAFAHLPTKPTRVVAGPLRRTHDTAIAIALSCSAAVITDQRLIDRDYGPWTGQPVGEVRERWGTDLDPLPDAEPLATVTTRALAVLEDAGDHIRDHRDGPVVLVSHDAVLTALLAALEPGLGSASGIDLDTASWSHLTLDGSNDDCWKVVRVGGAAHELGNRRAP
jgi:broad specificity phosphatase PhoE